MKKKLTAIAVEDLKSKGLEVLENEIKLTLKGNAVPNTYGECIGRYDISTGEYESFFKRDIEAGNTKYFDQYREKCNLFEKHRNIYNRSENTEKQVVDYFVMYNIKESSKNRPTETEDYVDYDICMNGHHKCEYELLFTCGCYTRRIVIEYESNNIPMYGFICDLEAEVEGAFYHETDESNPFLKVLSDCEDCDDYCMITMFDETGMSYDVEIDSASDLMAMLVSVRLLSCEFIEEKTSIKSELDKGR